MLFHTPVSSHRPVAHAVVTISAGLVLLAAPLCAWAAPAATPQTAPAAHPPGTTGPSALPYGTGYERRMLTPTAQTLPADTPTVNSTAPGSAAGQGSGLGRGSPNGGGSTGGPGKGRAR